MTVFVQLILIIIFQVFILAGVVFSTFLGNGKEDRVVVNSATKLSLVWIIIPFLQKQDACFGAGVGFKGISIQTDYCQNARTLRYKLTDILVGCVIESALWEDNRHASTGFEEIQVALNKQNIASDFTLCLAVFLKTKFVLM